jgi:hypothetical protein
MQKREGKAVSKVDKRVVRVVEGDDTCSAYSQNP